MWGKQGFNELPKWAWFPHLFIGQFIHPDGTVRLAEYIQFDSFLNLQCALLQLKFPRYFYFPWKKTKQSAPFEWRHRKAEATSYYICLCSFLAHISRDSVPSNNLQYLLFALVTPKIVFTVQNQGASEKFKNLQRLLISKILQNFMWISLKCVIIARLAK
jgi:hypothetical protein